MALDTKSLKSKIFTFEKKVTKDITKVVEAGGKNLNLIIKNLPMMRGIDDEYVP